MTDNETCIEERWLRDLKWAVSSPFLMDSTVEPNDIDTEPDPPCSDRYTGHRVGYYFESLITHWLERMRRVEMLAKGFQVMEEGRTIGELDFVFRDEAGEVNHWEVAAKFYLYDREHEIDGSHLIGPNARDTFERKRDKIFGQQLPLSRKVFPEVRRRAAFVKGRVFYHPLQTGPGVLPDKLAPDHLRGLWLRNSEIAWLEEAKFAAFCLIGKPHWLSPERVRTGDASLLAYRDLQERLDAHFAGETHPVLLGAMFRDGDCWRERERLFVVADSWPINRD